MEKWSGDPKLMKGSTSSVILIWTQQTWTESYESYHVIDREMDQRQRKVKRNEGGGSAKWGVKVVRDRAQQREKKERIKGIEEREGLMLVRDVRDNWRES